jgi:hypothetical protein
MNLIFLALINLAHAPTGDRSYLLSAVCDDTKVEEDMQEIACDIEKAAREEGISEEWFIKGLIVNAYAESSLNPQAISPGKTSYGVFQLHVRGMGSGWEISDMKDVRKSTGEIIKEAKKMGIYSKKRNEKSATAFLCVKVLRPENSQEKAKKRVEMLENLF